MLNGTSILVTGATGSFGKAFIHTVLTRWPQVRRLVVFSRDELKQYELAQAYPAKDFPQLRFFLGDVRDAQRVQRAMEGVDIVIHAAALKQVPAAEYNPFECIKTNILGAQNVIEAAFDAGVQKVVALSTDKAAAPVNLYGATKLCSDKLFVAANNIRGARPIKLSVVRYGNVMCSRGSVIPYFQDRAASGTLPITDPRMTRFNIPLRGGVEMVLWALEHAWGGEILVPKLPSYRITDVAAAVGPDCRQEIVGIRPGEKLHEEMITASDSPNTVDLGRYYAILPAGGVGSAYGIDDYCAATGAQRVPLGFSYNSGDNPDFLSVAQLRDLLATHASHGAAC